MKKIALVLSLLSSSLGAIQGPNTLHGAPLTPENLDLFPQAIPAAVDENKALLARLVPLNIQTDSTDSPEAWQTAIGQAGQEPTYKPEGTYIIPVGDTHEVRISGPLNRLFSMLATNDPDNGRSGKLWTEPGYIWEQVKKFLQSKPTTYQTASVVAYGLKLQELVDQKILHHIRVPRAVLGYIGEPGKVNDDNCYVVQERVTAGKPLDPKAQPPVKLAQPVLQQYCQCIEGAGLWDTVQNGNVRYDDSVEPPVLHIVKHEQPSNSSATTDGILNADPSKYVHNVSVGFDELTKYLTAIKDTDGLKTVGEHLSNSTLAKENANKFKAIVDRINTNTQ